MVCLLFQKVNASKMAKKCLAGLLSEYVIAVFSSAGRELHRKIESSKMLSTVLGTFIDFNYLGIKTIM